MRALALVALLTAAATARADTAELHKVLVGPDDDAAAAAAKTLGQSTGAQATDVLVEALTLGAPPKVAVAMVQALAGKKDARAVALVQLYAHHRAPEVRRAALAALPRDGRATATLLRALGDSDAEVRAAAAAVIAQRRERAAEPRLLKLMEHRDPAAAGALAAIATPELAQRLSEMLGQVPDPILCTALGEMLKRADFGPEPIRVELVHTLSKVPGIDSTAVLVEYLAATERDKDRPSRLEAQKVVDERSRQ